MNAEERAVWLKTLKGGDQVCYKIKGSFGNADNVRVVFVKNVTPTGMVRVSDGTLFGINGRAGYTGCSSQHFIYLEPCTKAIEDFITRAKLIVKAGYSAFVLDSKRVNLSKVPNNLLEELVNLETRISMSLKEPVKPEPPKKMCTCGREATRVYECPQSGVKGDVCSDCYDIEACQDEGHGVTGESYSREECIEILEGRGWRSAFES